MCVPVRTTGDDFGTILIEPSVSRTANLTSFTDSTPCSEGDRLLRHDRGGIGEPLRRLVLALGGDDLTAHQLKLHPLPDPERGSRSG
jgi:hypothetical protein